MPALSIEIEKLYRKTSTRILVVLFALLSLGLGALYITGELSLGISLLNRGQFPVASLSWLMSLLLPFMALYISSASYTEDLTQGTFQNLQLLPIPRFQLFIGKQLASLGLLGILLLVQLVISTFIGIAVDGMPQLTQLLMALGEYLGALLTLGLVSLIGALLALLLQSSGLTLVAAYAGYVALAALGLFLPWLSRISIVTVMANYGDLLATFHWTRLFTLLAYYIMVSILALLVLDKRLAGAFSTRQALGWRFLY